MSFDRPYHRENREVGANFNQQADHNMPRLRGGDGSANMGDGTRFNGWWMDTPAAPGGAHNATQPGPVASGFDSDCYEIPAPQAHRQDHRHDYRQDRRQNGHAAQASGQRGGFDFNNNQQPLPWNTDNYRRIIHNAPIQVRRFTQRADDELYDYLHERNIAREFLHEIDLFFMGHPEIAAILAGRELLDKTSTFSPLEAYKLFVRGYTRPARYVDGIIKKDYFRLDRAFHYCPQLKKYDPELDEFFGDFGPRTDIFDAIDRAVLQGIRDMEYGHDVPVRLRILICYAIWGHPVDAYKYWEYTYQREYVAHQYLPDHIVLSHIPKPEDYYQPRAFDVSRDKKHWQVRLRMARAQDQGVDVLDVLLAEYKIALLRKGHGRVVIDRLCAEAMNRLDQERRHNTGADVVDMVMDDAVDRHPQPPRRRQIAHINNRGRAHGGFVFGRTQIKVKNAGRRGKKMRVSRFQRA